MTQDLFRREVLDAERTSHLGSISLAQRAVAPSSVLQAGSSNKPYGNVEHSAGATRHIQSNCGLIDVIKQLRAALASSYRPGV